MGQMSIYIRTQWTCLLAGSVFGADLVITNAVLQPSRGVPLLPSAEQKVSAPSDAKESPVDREIARSVHFQVFCGGNIYARIGLSRPVKESLLLRSPWDNLAVTALLNQKGKGAEGGMGHRLGPKLQAGRRRMLFLFLLSLFRPALSEQIRYTIPEELARGSLVGNLAKDLGLGLRDLPTRNLRVSAEKKFFTVNTDNGDLLVSDRIDREQVCGRKSTCVLELEMVAEKPLNFFHITVEIQDVNDNPPTFSQNVTELEISEMTPTGATFALESAQDSDVGVNSLQQYYLSPDPHFSLIQKENPDGSRYPELVVKAPLDREEQSCHHLVLMAVDGGEPARSCTTQIRVVVADANDNPPVFTQDVYRVSVPENLPLGSSVLRVRATDLDEGINAEIAYTFINVDKAVRQLFKLDSKTGELTTVGGLDFEERESYTIGVEAKDGGHHTAHCKIQIDILDENDNVPEITLDSESKYIKEDTELGTVVALIKTHDLDSGFNGEVLCQIKGNFPFKIVQDTKNTYKLVTERVLDREKTPEYNVTITATDKGKPPLSSKRSVTLKVADVNDNVPLFHQASYVVHVPENNPPGTSIAQVNASDPDLGSNGQVSYSIVASDLEPRALSSYVSVNPQSGVVFAQRAFDHEQLRVFELTLQARDHGSPALSSNVSLRVLVGDRNDNAPRVLYPALGPDGSALFDTVPRAAQPGYLVTKVVAVDADSGHNAWLSYHVLQASEPGLFSVGLRTGEVRTARALGDRDAARQRLLVAVRDGGQPPLSATATLLLVFADSLQEALPDLSDRPSPSDPQAELQFYLVVALALISVLFLLAVILAVALHLRRSSSPAAWGCFKPGLCVKSGPVVPPNYSEGTLPYSYNLCVAHTGKTEFNFLRCSEPLHPTQDIVCGDSPGALIPLHSGNDLATHPETLTPQAPPNTDWRFSQAQRPGTSGSQNGDETGTWPNNQFDTEMLQAMILASASEAADGSSTLGGGAGTMGLSARYGPQFTLQHVPDYRQNVYIPGSNATLTNAAGKRDGKAPAGGNGNKKKSGKKEKK